MAADRWIIGFCGDQTWTFWLLMLGVAEVLSSETKRLFSNQAILWLKERFPIDSLLEALEDMFCLLLFCKSADHGGKREQLQMQIPNKSLEGMLKGPPKDIITAWLDYI